MLAHAICPGLGRQEIADLRTDQAREKEGPYIELDTNTLNCSADFCRRMPNVFEFEVKESTDS